MIENRLDVRVHTLAANDLLLCKSAGPWLGRDRRSNSIVILRVIVIVILIVRVIVVVILIDSNSKTLIFIGRDSYFLDWRPLERKKLI